MATLEVKSEVTGSVWKIAARPGQVLAAGTTIMILESMKMEIPVILEDGGTLSALHVAEGESVTEGQIIATLTE
ncbi:MAG: acetyl-CoA carboxylase biotin carboxyl carrier protein subunit [Betaproteobacteria bacterium RIFCSPLOWO2_02_FULL_67_19]|nr:MAG: acetyl-CoA carboxylase biotin carboxyl carrier protein subunit [Betaproteobacteria bacterium RIFCSPLOWO2_02_FULL_67_19]